MTSNEPLTENDAVQPASLRVPRARVFDLAGAVLATARPRQWIKNLLLFAAPAAAGVLADPRVFGQASLAFASFSAVASGSYFLNDSVDYEADQTHPTKRHRPVAAGAISQKLAVVVGLLLIAAGASVALLLENRLFFLILGIYVMNNLLYSLKLKEIAVVDLAVVASGFLIRAIAGGLATDVPLSEWFLIVASFGSLFVVAGKRGTEHVTLGEARADHRPTLGEYSASFLRHVRSISAAVTLGAYCLWAFDKAAVSENSIWFQLSIAPFVLGILRYTLLIDYGQAGAPEEIALKDRPLQAIGALWVLTLALGIYVR